MNIVLIEEQAYERMKCRIRELTELVGELSRKTEPSRTID